MRKLLIFCFALFLIQKVNAGDKDKFVSVGAGFQLKNVMNSIVSLEFERKYSNAYELYLHLSKVSDIEKSYGIGLAYNQSLYRYMNSRIKARLGADMGENNNGFQAAIQVGFEYSKSIGNRMQLFVLQQNSITFFSEKPMRYGLLIGIKIPINK